MYQINSEYSSMTETNAGWKGLYRLGGAAAMAAIAGSLLDIVVSMLPGWSPNVASITAIERFEQFQSNWLHGLYNLDLLNNVISVIMIPIFCALYLVHRKVQKGYGLLSLVLFIIGTGIFIANNAALPMLDLSIQYAAATTDAHKSLLAAAAEAILTKGEHGSPGAFAGFALSTIASLTMAYTMLKGKIFGKAAAYVGLIGFTMLLLYTILITFVTKADSIILLVAMPGGILAMVWNTMVAKKLLQLSHKNIK